MQGVGPQAGGQWLGLTVTAGNINKVLARWSPCTWSLKPEEPAALFVWLLGKQEHVLSGRTQEGDSQRGQ